MYILQYIYIQERKKKSQSYFFRFCHFSLFYKMNETRVHNFHLLRYCLKTAHLNISIESSVLFNIRDVAQSSLIPNNLHRKTNNFIPNFGKSKRNFRCFPKMKRNVSMKVKFRPSERQTLCINVIQNYVVLTVKF